MVSAGAEPVAAGAAAWFPFAARAMVAARRAAEVTPRTATAALSVPVLSFSAGGHMVDDDYEMKEEEGVSELLPLIKVVVILAVEKL
jgi:hypothetical protein